MAKDPAVLFYTSDFLSGTSFFTMEQRGQYITLLCEQHQNGHIPENHMIIVCLSLDSVVIKKFKKDAEGNYYNERMDLEKEKRVNFCNSRSNNKSGRPKKKSIDKSYDNHKIIHMENDNDNGNINRIKDEEIQKIYDLYPSRDPNHNGRATGKCSKDKIKIGKILQTGIDLKKRLMDYVIDCNKTKTYLKNFSVFLNQLPETPKWEKNDERRKTGLQRNSRKPIETGSTWSHEPECTLDGVSTG